MASINSSSLSNQLLSVPTSSTSNDASDSKGKSASEGATKETSAVPTSEANNPYASVNGSQKQTENRSQNINTNFSQTSGATPDSTDDFVSGDSDDDEDTTNGGYSIKDPGVSHHQKIAFKGGDSDRRKGSHRGSDDSLEKDDLYIPSAAAELQKGKRLSKAASTDISNFTLKLDNTALSTGSTFMDESSKYVNLNGSPKIPHPTNNPTKNPTTTNSNADPNVYAMVEESANLASNLQEEQLVQMVASSNSQNQQLSQEYSIQIAAMIQYQLALSQAKAAPTIKQQVMTDLMYCADAATIAAGFATAQPEVVAMGVGMLATSLCPKMTAGLTHDLEKAGLPPQYASVVATLIIIIAITIVGGGLGGIAKEALAAGSEAALAETGASTTLEALTTSAGQTAYYEAAKSALYATAKSTAEGVGNTASATAASMGRCLSQLGEAMADLSSEGFMSAAGKGVAALRDMTMEMATDASTTVYNTAVDANEAAQAAARAFYRALCNPCDTASYLFKASGKALYTSGKAVVNATAKATTSVARNIGESILHPSIGGCLKVVEIGTDASLTGVTIQADIDTYKANQLQSKATDAAANVLLSQAQTQALTSCIQMALDDTQTILNDMNSIVSGAGSILAQMSSLSAETLGHLRGSRA